MKSMTDMWWHWIKKYICHVEETVDIPSVVRKMPKRKTVLLSNQYYLRDIEPDYRSP
jgi:hypothetical protein